jgi:hypothetical protein
MKDQQRKSDQTEAGGSQEQARTHEQEAIGNESIHAQGRE